MSEEEGALPTVPGQGLACTGVLVTERVSGRPHGGGATRNTGRRGKTRGSGGHTHVGDPGTCGEVGQVTLPPLLQLWSRSEAGGRRPVSMEVGDRSHSEKAWRRPANRPRLGERKIVWAGLGTQSACPACARPWAPPPALPT